MALKWVCYEHDYLTSQKPKEALATFFVDHIAFYIQSQGKPLQWLNMGLRKPIRSHDFW